jgi:hypothetical protein
VLGQRFKVDGGLSTIAPRIEDVGIFREVARKRRLSYPVAPLGLKLASAL